MGNTANGFAFSNISTKWLNFTVAGSKVNFVEAGMLRKFGSIHCFVGTLL